MTSNIVKKYSNGVFPIRFTGYMNGGYGAIHQQALLIYNKKGVRRKTALSRLSTINLDPTHRSQLHRTIIGDKNDPTLLPILNFPNYAPYEDGGYRNEHFVSVNELEACIGINCMEDAHGMHYIVSYTCLGTIIHYT